MDMFPEIQTEGSTDLQLLLPMPAFHDATCCSWDGSKTSSVPCSPQLDLAGTPSPTASTAALYGDLISLESDLYGLAAFNPTSTAQQLKEEPDSNTPPAAIQTAGHWWAEEPVATAGSTLGWAAQPVLRHAVSADSGSVGACSSGSAWDSASGSEDYETSSDEDFGHTDVVRSDHAVDRVATPPSSPDYDEDCEVEACNRVHPPPPPPLIHAGQRDGYVHTLQRESRHTEAARAQVSAWMAAKQQQALHHISNSHRSAIMLPPRPVAASAKRGVHHAAAAVAAAAGSAPKCRALGLKSKSTTKKRRTAPNNSKKAELAQAKKAARLAAAGGCGAACPFCHASDTLNAAREQESDGNHFAASSSTGLSASVSAADSAMTAADTRLRHRRRMKKPRLSRKMGVWWRKYGYNGEPYCQRCSEIFRDHIIRGFSNSCNCSRDTPCNDCAKILNHFPGDRRELYALMDNGGRK